MEAELVQVLLQKGNWGLLIGVLWLFKNYIRFSFGKNDGDK